MQYIKKLPVLIRWLVSIFFCFLIPMSIFRYIFFLRFHPVGKPFTGSAFIMGLRFDAKFTSMLIVLMLLLCAFRLLNPFKNSKAISFWNIFLPLIFFILLIFYIGDYYHYDYLHQRLNANILSYTADAGISSKMMLQSYPVVSIVLLLLTGTVLASFVFKKILSGLVKEERIQYKRRTLWNVLFFVLLGLTVFGKLGQFPLRWSDAFTLSDDFKSNLSLNPFQSFFSTLRFKDSKPDIKMVKKYYPLISAYMGVKDPDSATLNYERNYLFAGNETNRPNIVLVICESFSMYKSSMSGNPLNTTPYFNKLCNEGTFFERCFTPAYGTARGVWATVTGIPDVLGTSKQTASRNPAAVDQHVIINDFKGYDRFYFLGGDPTWANIQGLLKNNIEGLQLYSQDEFKAAKVDVWGISDKHLFLEANKILAGQQKPFFAIIQTADNHRPYTIPSEDLERFKKVSFPTDSLKKYGFDNNDELNAFRYTDFCYQEFIESARKEKYFDNTVFVFVGDHGIGGEVGNVYPRSWTEQHLADEHVPLLFYSPKYIQPKKISSVCSQIDILPSIASVAKMPYTSRTLGRNLFDTTNHADTYAFIMEHNENTIGVVNNKYYFVKNIGSGKEDYVSVTDNEKIPSGLYSDSVKKYMKSLTDAFYHTARYLIVNNKKNK
jgi:phosphoglycerol transferase MdoB-like AlkP superfamily enzyme